MKMLMNVKIPHEPFNTLVREGTVGEIIRRILDDEKPVIFLLYHNQGRE